MRKIGVIPGNEPCHSIAWHHRNCREGVESILFSLVTINIADDYVHQDFWTLNMCRKWHRFVTMHHQDKQKYDVLFHSIDMSRKSAYFANQF